VTGEGLDDLNVFLANLKNRNIQNAHILGKDDAF
jgi:hypothetical protein